VPGGGGRPGSRRDRHRFLTAVASVLLLIIFGTGGDLRAQSGAAVFRPEALSEHEPCAADTTGLFETLRKRGPGFGYSYDSLLADLGRWKSSPYIRIDSIGSSVQRRAIWRVTVARDPAAQVVGLHVAMHARTHPMEVESSWLARAVVQWLAGGDPAAEALRAACTFTIVPMYNPDGVELGYARENAHRVDLERGWESAAAEPEVSVLRALYQSAMQSPAPLRVMLNLHSASGKGVRYFVYHHENGTSASFAQAERRFIDGVRAFWTAGIGPWDTFVSWTTGTPPYYPESWFWLHYGESVMALTYEEVYGVTDMSVYPRSADALLRGIADYLGIALPVDAGSVPSAELIQAGFRLGPPYPQPLRGGASLTARFSVRQRMSLRLALVDLLGRERAVAPEREYHPGTFELMLPAVPLDPGMYLLVLNGREGAQAQRIIVTR
jgi:hypothetical protein